MLCSSFPSSLSHLAVSFMQQIKKKCCLANAAIDVFPSGGMVMICHWPEIVLSWFSRWYRWLNEIEKSCSFTFLATAVVRLWAKGRSCTFPCQAVISSDCGSGLCLLVRQHDWKCKYMKRSVISELVFPKCVMRYVKATWVCISTHPLQADFHPCFVVNFPASNWVYI